MWSFLNGFTVFRGGSCELRSLPPAPVNRGVRIPRGGRGIRTPGEFPHNGFQDRHIRPLCQPSSAKSAIPILAGESRDADFWKIWGNFARVKTLGDVAERPNVTVLKTVVGQPPTVGSNPTLTAYVKSRDIVHSMSRDFLCGDVKCGLYLPATHHKTMVFRVLCWVTGRFWPENVNKTNKSGV